MPSSFRIARQLLSRLENELTGQIIAAGFHVDIPPERRTQAHQAAEVLNEDVYAKFPFIAGAHRIASNRAELVLNRTWRPALEITGASYIPLRMPATCCDLSPPSSFSLRLPPTANAPGGPRKISSACWKPPSLWRQRTLRAGTVGGGWNAPALSPRFVATIDSASRLFFGKPAMYMGEGGSIPFMGMLGTKFPEAQFWSREFSVRTLMRTAPMNSFTFRPPGD
ncbi:MAG: hypothetical protein MZV65_28850 [Chromatiales bacterium]|nr:hypothetical protein [Chromatiales bacterium]